MLLLITGCIKPHNIDFLELRDSTERLKMYIESIKFYIEHSQFTKIVFCENSNFKNDYKELVELSIRNNKKIEILSFEGNMKEVLERGKGYGEGEIIEYAIKNSKLLHTVNYFYKVTGRIIIRNVNEIVEKENKRFNYFNKNLYSYKSLDTRFWGIDKAIYIKYFMEIYKKVDDKNLDFFEYVFYKQFVKEKINYKCHCIFPLVEGTSATMNMPYSENKIYLRASCKLGVYNCKMIYTINYFLFNAKKIFSTIKNNRMSSYLKYMFDFILNRTYLLYCKLFKREKK